LVFVEHTADSLVRAKTKLSALWYLHRKRFHERHYSIRYLSAKSKASELQLYFSEDLISKLTYTLSQILNYRRTVENTIAEGTMTITIIRGDLKDSGELFVIGNFGTYS
jgi:hypothetical protein